MKTKSTLFKLITFLLVVVSCFSVCGCTQAPSSSGYKPKEELTFEKTGSYLFKDGQSEYQILIPEVTDWYSDFASKELQFGIKEATGYTMPITSIYNEGNKYLSVAETALYLENKEQIDGQGHKFNEARITTIGNNVFFTGDTTEYACYAAYDFMEFTFGFKWYHFEQFVVDKSNEIPVYKINNSNIPSAEFRWFFQYDFITAQNPNAQQNATRLRTWALNESHYGIFGHNATWVLKKENYTTEQREAWFSIPHTHSQDPDHNKGQLCMTNEDLLAEYIKQVKIIIEKENFSKSMFCQFMNDEFHSCMCSNCVALSEEMYGRADDPNNRAALEIRFTNKVSQAINEWLEEVRPGKRINFITEAYAYNRKAPVKLDENGNYVPVHPDAVPIETVYISLVPGGTHEIAMSNPKNSGYENMNQWMSLTKNNVYYSYGVPYYNNVYPMPDLNYLGQDLKLAADQCSGYMEEAHSASRYGQMQPLRQYVTSQMLWDSSKNFDELAFEFIDVFYAPVAQEFKDYYVQLKQFFAWQVDVADMVLKITDTQIYCQDKYWPKGTIDAFDEMLDNMLNHEKLLAVKELNEEQYKEYWDRINVEKLWVYNCYVRNHDDKFTKEVHNARIDYMIKYMDEYFVYRPYTSQIDSYRKK